MFDLQFASNIFLFFFGFLGIFLNKRSIVVILVSIEILLLSVNLNFIFTSIYLDDFYGQIFSLFILTIAASEAGIGLAILILYYKLNGNVFVDSALNLRG